MDWWDLIFRRILKGEEVPVDDEYHNELQRAMRVKADYESLVRAADRRIEEIHLQYMKKLDSELD